MPEKSHRLSSRGWLLMLAITVAVVILLVYPIFNIVTDPFGVFGDPIFKWWSYDQTMNPRTAKISYLAENHEKYDSYIIGCSSTSSFPVASFNEYFGAKFYNLFGYGSDMYDAEKMVFYLVENYEVKNIILNAYIGIADGYNVGEDTLTDCLPCSVSGANPLAYWSKFLFASPNYGIEKLKKLAADSYLQAPHDVFEVESGAYDKSLRDIEGIGALDEYVTRPAYAGFAYYPQVSWHLPDTEKALDSLERIVNLCREKGINLTVIAGPVYGEAYAKWWPREEVEGFYRSLAEIVDYWDFSCSSVSLEPRYFYDETHFRNSVGEMIAARIAGDDSVYIPDDFGRFITRENVDAMLEKTAEFLENPSVDTSAYTARLPILLYHHLTEAPGSGATISVSAFEAQLAALLDAGYTPVGFDDLRAYVNRGIELPEKPVLVCFDDGYESNATLALPILEQYGVKSTIFIIGATVGSSEYKDTGKAMTPHFDFDTAREIEASGLVTIESHGYDIHEVEGLDPDPIRRGILRRDDESEDEYLAFLESDFDRVESIFAGELDKKPTVLSYPYGLHEKLAAVYASRRGYDITLTTDPHVNTLIKGLPQSLYELGRFQLDDSVSPEVLLEMIK